MKRSPIRRSQKRPKRLPGERVWKTPRWGRCRVCGTWGRVIRHHVVREQHIRREGGDLWDLRNAMTLGGPGVCGCHSLHHSAIERLPLEKVPYSAWTFAVELMGRERAADYFQREYQDDPTSVFT